MSHHRGRGRGHSVSTDDRHSVFRPDRLNNTELKIGFETHGGGFNRGMQNALIRDTASTYGVGVVRSSVKGADVTVMSGSPTELGNAVGNDPLRFGGNPSGSIMRKIRLRRLQAGIIGDRLESGTSRGHTVRDKRLAAVSNQGHTAVRTGVHEVGHAMNLDHPSTTTFPNIMQPTVTGFQRNVSTPEQKRDVKEFITGRRRARSL